MEEIKLKDLIRVFEKEGIENFIVIRKRTFDKLTKEHKDVQDDLTSVYLSGTYDERNRWMKKIKEKIEEWDKSIKWNNADDCYYAIKILQELMEDK